VLLSAESVEVKRVDVLIPAEDAVAIDESAPDGDLAPLVEDLLRRLGEDPLRPGLTRTPSRVGRSLRHLTAGYGMSLAEVVGEGIFPESSRGPVVLRRVEFFSLCEHHLLPFYGWMDIGYAPDGRVLGLSKIARVIDMFAKRLQTQEHLTAQVAQGIWDAVEPVGVAVLAEATHLCMSMRGVQKSGAMTRTSAVVGDFDLAVMRG
jgi:GTP cyclohydrolase I